LNHPIINSPTITFNIEYHISLLKSEMSMAVLPLPLTRRYRRGGGGAVAVVFFK
jgi:hypothetical protein